MITVLINKHDGIIEMSLLNLFSHR